MLPTRGTPDRFVKENGSGGGGGGTVDQGSAGTDAWLVGLDPANLAVLSGIATERTLARFVGPYSIPVIGSLAVTGETPLFAPPAGLQLRVRRIWVKGAYDIGDGVGVEFIVKVGSTIIANDDVIASQPYADGVVKLGDVDAVLTLELLTAHKVFYNISVEAF